MDHFPDDGDWTDGSFSGPDYPLVSSSSSEKLTDGHGEGDVASVVSLDQFAPQRRTQVPVLEVTQEAEAGAGLVEGNHRVLGQRHGPVVNRDGLGDDQLGEPGKGPRVEDGHQVLVSEQRCARTLDTGQYGGLGQQEVQTCNKNTWSLINF